MKLTILGSGDFRPDYPLASAGYVLQTATTTLKLDFGRGNLVNMARAGIDWKSLDAILLTHVHADHISDLFQYLQVFAHLNHTGEMKKQMVLYGPHGFETFFDHFRRMIITSWDTIPAAHELFDDRVAIGDCVITTLPMKHAIDAIGYRIESAGTVLCYTGDTEIHDNLIALAKNAHVLLVECSGTNAEPIEGHMRPTDIARVAREAGVRKVVLTHYPGDPAQRAQLVAAVKEECVAEVIGAEDLMTIDI